MEIKTPDDEELGRFARGEITDARRVGQIKLLLSYNPTVKTAMDVLTLSSAKPPNELEVFLYINGDHKNPARVQQIRALLEQHDPATLAIFLQVRKILPDRDFSELALLKDPKDQYLCLEIERVRTSNLPDIVSSIERIRLRLHDMKESPRERLSELLNSLCTIGIALNDLAKETAN